MSIIGSNILAGASGQAGGGYQISRSLRFNSRRFCIPKPHSRLSGQQEDVDLGGVGEEECAWDISIHIRKQDGCKRHDNHELFV
jgi:hypothetical protein